MLARTVPLILIVGLTLGAACDKASEPAAGSAEEQSPRDAARVLVAEYEQQLAALAGRATALVSESDDAAISWDDLSRELTDEQRRALFGDLLDDERVFQAKASLNRSEMDFRLVYMRSLNLRGRTGSRFEHPIGDEQATVRIGEFEDLDTGESTSLVTVTLERTLDGERRAEVELMLRPAHR